MINHKNEFNFEIKNLDSDGSFAGYASVFNLVDSQNDTIINGAFMDSIKNRADEIKLLWQHKPDEPIGKIINLQEDNYGLFIIGSLDLNISKAREAYSLLKEGIITSMSIGYNVIDSQYDQKDDIRKIYKVNLWEISLVTFPANSNAVITRVKNKVIPSNIREFENYLRNAGFSRNKSKIISSCGYNAAYDTYCYDYKQLSQVLESLDRSISMLLSWRR